MSISSKDLEKIAGLAYLGMDMKNSDLANDVIAIMDFVEQLRSVDTQGIAPLFRPFDLHQRLRPDEVSEADCLAEIEAIAPQFEDGMYLVPKVIDTEN